MPSPTTLPYSTIETTTARVTTPSTTPPPPRAHTSTSSDRLGDVSSVRTIQQKVKRNDKEEDADWRKKEAEWQKREAA
ncbi:hypothetical protein SESBI_46536 [Sesbania bispinosa]|nr:hypothetical protein SESBI_46536 [Sesbania bispinosa]